VREAGCIFLGKIAMPDFGTLRLGIPSLHGSQCAYEDTLKVLRLVDPARPGNRLPARLWTSPRWTCSSPQLRQLTLEQLGLPAAM
jgi:hypothetical protein